MVVLSSARTGDVTVTIMGQNGSDLSLDKTVLMFYTNKLERAPESDGDGREGCGFCR